MKDKVSRFVQHRLVSKIVACGAWVMLASAICVLAYMSFVDTFMFSPSVKSLTTFGLVSLILNVSLWESFYDSLYTKQLNFDMDNEEYSVHKRYYFARKGWKYSDLQLCVRNYNKEFREAWIQDIEDITGRSVEDIKRGRYRGNTHKFLIWRVKHDKYPTTGIKIASDLLYILSVGKSSRMRLDLKESEKFHANKLIWKILSSIATSALVASFGFEFIQGNYLSAILRLVITIVMVCFTVFLGASAGYKSAKIKLSTAEAVSEKLEEWRDKIPSVVPYKDDSTPSEQQESTEDKDENFDQRVIEIG